MGIRLGLTLAAMLALMAALSKLAGADSLWVKRDVGLSWTDAEGTPDSYCIEYTLDGAAWSPVMCRPAQERPRLVLPACQTIAYRVVAVRGEERVASDASEWTRSCGNPDLDGDGSVRGRDVAEAAARFGCTVSSDGRMACR